MKKLFLLLTALSLSLLLCSCTYNQTGGETTTETEAVLNKNPEAPEIDYSLYPHDKLEFVDFLSFKNTKTLSKILIEKASDLGTSVRVRVVGYELAADSAVYEEDGSPPYMDYYVQVVDDFHGGTLFDYSEVHKAHVYGTPVHERYCQPPFRIGEEYVLFGCYASKRDIKGFNFDFTHWFEIKSSSGVDYIYPYTLDISALDYAIKITDIEENKIYRAGIHDAEIKYMNENNMAVPTFEYKLRLDDFLKNYRGITYGETYIPPETTTREEETVIQPDAICASLISCKTPVCEGGFCDTPEVIYKNRIINGDERLCFYNKSDGLFYLLNAFSQDVSPQHIKYSEYTGKIYFTKPGEAIIYSASADFSETEIQLGLYDADCSEEAVYLASCLDKYLYFGYTGNDGIYHRYWYNLQTEEKREFSSGSEPSAWNFPIITFKHKTPEKIVDMIYYSDLAFYEFAKNDMEYSKNSKSFYYDDWQMEDGSIYSNREYFSDYLAVGSKCVMTQIMKDGRPYRIYTSDFTNQTGYYTQDMRISKKKPLALLFTDGDYTYYSYVISDSPDACVRISRIGLSYGFGEELDVLIGEKGTEYKNMFRYGGDIFMDIYEDGEWQGYFRYAINGDGTLRLIGADTVTERRKQ